MERQPLHEIPFLSHISGNYGKATFTQIPVLFHNSGNYGKATFTQIPLLFHNSGNYGKATFKTKFPSFLTFLVTTERQPLHEIPFLSHISNSQLCLSVVQTERHGASACLQRDSGGLPYWR